MLCIRRSHAGEGSRDLRKLLLNRSGGGFYRLVKRISTVKEDVMPLSSEEREQLANAKFLLENPSLAVKITDAIGTPIEKGFGRLPAGWQASIQKTTNKALMSALNVAVGTMNNKKSATSSRNLHKGLVALSGAVGGAFGLPALAIELPVSTTIMLRSIADIARSHGEEISKIEVRIACLQVFALGVRLLLTILQILVTTAFELFLLAPYRKQHDTLSRKGLLKKAPLQSFDS